MTARRAEAALVVAVAAAIAAWFLLALRAHHYSDEVQRVAQTANLQRPADVSRLEDLYAKAESWNADPTPRIGRASLDLALGHRAPAIAALRKVTHENPGNLPARLVLVRALAQAGDASGTEAVAAQLRRLYGRVGATSRRLVIRDHDGRLLPVVTDWVETPVDGIVRTRRTVSISGAAFSRAARAPADEVLVLTGGRLRATVPLTRPRRDVSRAADLPPGRYGFVVRIPATAEAGLQLFAVQGGIATAVPLRGR